MKKVLVVNTVTYSINGIATVIMNYYEKIDHEKFQWDFVVNGHMEQKYLQIMKKYHANLFYMDRFGHPMQYFLKLKQIIRENGYDVIHVHGNSCTMAIELCAGKLAKCPMRAAHVHNTACEHKKLNKLLRPLFEWACTTRISCGSEAGKWLYRGKEFEVLENAMDLSKYQFEQPKRDGIRKKLNIQNDEILLGHIGIFNEQKNQVFAIRVLYALCRNNGRYKLVLVGQGESEGRIRKEVKALGLQDRVIFYGTTDDVPGILSAIDIFLFPSKYEGLGIAAIEAQLMGLPCVLSDAVPDAAVISTMCQKISLDGGVDEWCKAVISYGEYVGNRSQTGLMESSLERFDIGKQVGNLERLYGGEPGLL